MARKQIYCETCDKMRNDVKSMGIDANGDPDSPDMCFLCRKEWEKGKSYCTKCKKYVYGTFCAKH